MLNACDYDFYKATQKIVYTLTILYIKEFDVYVVLDYRYYSLSVAIGRPVKMSSVRPDCPPEYSVDGCVRLEPTTFCAITKSSKNNWWEVQLARAFDIKEVIVYHNGLYLS